MQDYMEVLGALKATMKQEIDEKTVDTITTIETLNPELTADSKKYRDSNKIIFKEEISSKSAHELVSLVTNTKQYNISNISLYKEEILSKCNIIYAQGENPIEMLVYSIKGLANEFIYINAIRDVIKSFYEDSSELIVTSYRNILNKWSWNDCLEFVLKSITELKIHQLSEDVYYVFKINNINRELAAKTIISLEATELFENLINFLCTLDNESTTEIDKLRNILYYMAKYNNQNTVYIYKCYIQLTVNREVSNILIGAIRFNVDRVILDHIEKCLKNSELSYQAFRKLIILLSKSKQANVNIVQILTNALRISHLDEKQKDFIRRALGDDTPEMQMEIIKDKRKGSRERRDAIISMAKSGDENYLKLLDEVAEESHGFNAVVCSVRVQRGDNSQLIELFKYIVTREENDEVSMEATNQIKRLRTLKDENINRALLEVASKLLADDELSNIKKVNKILDIFSSGVPNDEVGQLFLNKLKSTKHSIIKNKIIEFYRKEFNRLKLNTLKTSIKEAILNCTYEEEVSKVAMECLKSMNSYVESVPSLGVIN